MQRRHIRWAPILIALAFLAYQFLTSEKFVNPETGRTVHVGMSEQQEMALGLQSYKQVLSESRVVDSGPQVDLVRRVAQRLTGVVDDSAKNFQWHVSVVDDPQQNAFCLPGGKIVVFTGILPVAQTEAGLATVMGHEIAHATSRHGAARVFKDRSLQVVMQGVAGSTMDLDPAQRQTVMGLLGAGAQYGIALPFGRQDELEADEVGLIYMARAGYDPRESIGFWQRMQQASKGKKPPEFMSTHPADETRISRLEALMPKAMEIYQQASKR